MKVDMARIAEDIKTGLVDPAIFHDEELYQLELNRIFGRSWLFLGHTSMLQNPGEYITTYMGETPVIVLKNQSGEIGAFINRCSHRSLQLCGFDRGTAKHFSCPYHGWTYNLSGELTHVPEVNSYPSTFDQSKLGLIPVARVAEYAGFIFGNLDSEALDLDEYLGDMKFYFDQMFSGGVEISPIKQRVTSDHNWKIAADNGSDNYHVAVSHAAAFGSLHRYTEFMVQEFASTITTITSADPDGPGHTVAMARALEDAEGYDLEMARSLDEESLIYMRERYKEIGKMDSRVAPGYFAVAAIFPSLLMVDIAPRSVAIAMEVWHPKGPNRTETWLYVFVEKNAPQSLKNFAAKQQMRFHSFSGTVVPDDHENWERVQDGSKSVPVKDPRIRIDLGNEETSPQEWRDAGYFQLPGQVHYGMTEAGSRSFYSGWIRKMQEA